LQKPKNLGKKPRQPQPHLLQTQALIETHNKNSSTTTPEPSVEDEHSAKVTALTTVEAKLDDPGFLTAIPNELEAKLDSGERLTDSEIMKLFEISHEELQALPTAPPYSEDGGVNPAYAKQVVEFFYRFSKMPPEVQL
jgi:hypothetical protein